MKSNKQSGKKEKRSVASPQAPRYNDEGVPAPASTLGDFHTEDQALEYLAEILVAAYFQQKTV